MRLVWDWALRAVGRDRSASDRSVVATNIRLLYWDIAWFGVLFGVINNFLVVFVARLDPSPWLISAVTSGPALINVLWQLPAARIVERLNMPRQLTVYAALPQRCGFLLIALLPLLLPTTWQAYGIVAIILLQAFPTAIMFVAFQTLFTELVPRQRMAQVVGMRNVLLGATSTAMALMCGIVLSAVPFPWGYQIIFLLGFLASLGSVWSVARLQTGDAGAAPRTEPDVGEAQRPGRPHRDGNFMRFATGAGILHLGMFMTAPLFPLYWVGTLHLSDGWISILASTLTLTSVIGAFGMRAIDGRFNLGVILAVSSLLFALYPLLTSVITHPWLLVTVTAFSGIWGGAINVALFSTLAEVCPPVQRSRYIGYYTWLMNIAIFAAPLAGAAFAELAGVVPALVGGGLLRAFAALLFWRLPFVSWDTPAVPAGSSVG